MKEIRLHGRGGQGVVVASEILVSAFYKDGKYAHSLPFFGVERRGAPVVAFVRCDTEPIWEKSQVYSPDCIVAMDLRLLKAVDIFAGAKDDSFLVINSEKFNIEHAPPQVSIIGRVNATRIALECLGAPITSTCMLGSFAATTGWVSLNAIIEGVEELLPREIAEANQNAVKRAFQETSMRKRVHA